MIIAVTIIHVIVSIGLILVVLLQTGKGAEMGAVFGGSSSTIFGSSGAGNFLTRLTTAMAIIFMITSLTLGYFSGRRSSSSVFDTRSESVPAAPRPLPAPAAPQGAPTAPQAPAAQAPAQPTAPSAPAQK
jgi:preprotein translocase subunit SecG